MTEEWDFSQMGILQIEELEDRAEKCIPILRGDFEKLAIAKLSLAAYKHGWDRGRTKATEDDDQAKTELQRTSKIEKESVIQDYDALVDRYNSLANDYNRDNGALVNRYNSLVNDYNSLLGLAQKLVALPPTRSSFFSLIPPPTPPPREMHLTCTATALPGNMATINCW
jgi:hypothetical protein